MKNILVTAAIVLGLTACGDGTTTNDAPTTDTSTMGGGLTTDTSMSPNMNPVDSAGLYDTSITDRTRVTQPSDTLRRRDSAR